MRYAIRPPSAEIFPWYPRGSGSGASTAPSTGTVQKRGAPLGAQVARPDVKRMRLPSGAQPCTASAPGCHVRRFGSPPVAATTYTSAFPAYSPLKAIQRPSGEKCGLDVWPWKLVSRRARPPDRSTTQMLFP
jgi:hypothetical protein